MWWSREKRENTVKCNQNANENFCSQDVIEIRSQNKGEENAEVTAAGVDCPQFSANAAKETVNFFKMFSIN